MQPVAQNENPAEARIILGLLDSVERDGAQSQRRLAAELGIALGLVNSYMKKCIRKGLLKATHAPARRYIYYLTPRGFAEKSRLTVEYLSSSFEFFRHAKADCAAMFDEAGKRGFDRVALVGKSDLAEIAAICALESGIDIVGIVDKVFAGQRFIGLPVVGDYLHLSDAPDGIIITDLVSPFDTCRFAIENYGTHRVLIPSLLRVRTAPDRASI